MQGFFEPDCITTILHRCNHGFVVFFSSSGRKEKDHTSSEGTRLSKKIAVIARRACPELVFGKRRSSPCYRQLACSNTNGIASYLAMTNDLQYSISVFLITLPEAIIRCLKKVITIWSRLFMTGFQNWYMAMPF